MRKPTFNPAKKRYSFRFFLILPAFLAAVAGAAWALMPGPDWWQPKVEQALESATGRSIKLGGAVKLSVSWKHGFVLKIEDVTVSNPSWASRPLMAKIGSLSLGVRLPPLLQGNVEIASVALDNADVLLETSRAGKGNWEFAKDEENATAEAKENAAPKSKGEVKVSVDSLSIANSRMGFRSPDGKTTDIKADSLSASANSKSTSVKFDGAVSGASLSAAMEAGGYDRITEDGWPFAVNLRYDGKHDVEAKGTLSAGGKKVSVSKYAVKTGGSAVGGEMEIDLRGQRPAIIGTLAGEKVDLSDFASADPQDESSAKKSTAAKNGNGLVFSAEPLDLSAMKSADAKIDVRIGEIRGAVAPVKNLQTKAELSGGRLTLSPLKAEVAGSVVEGQTRLDASSSPTKASIIMKAGSIDVSKLLDLWGAESLLSGNADMNMDVMAYGNSPHDMASNSNGVVNLAMAGGTVSNQLLGGLAGSVADAFLPGAGKLLQGDVNCLAMRLALNNGQGKVSGLMDTSHARATTTGNVNLSTEGMDTLIKLKGKQIDDGKLIPPMQLTGTLANPKFAFGPTAGGILDAATSILNGTIGKNGGGAVQPLPAATNGGNACVQALNSGVALQQPTASGSSASAISPNGGDVVKKGLDAIKGLGGGLFGN